MSYSASANRYAKQVVGGKMPACRWVVLACRRHLNDLESSKGKDYPYRFDSAEVERVCGIVELLPHVKGRWAAKKELIHLEPWECFIFASLFGWRRKKDGLRRYRHAYIAVPRKNGKSIIAAAIGVVMWGFDGECGAEVYCGATTEAQAWEVFRPAKMMVDRSPELQEAIGAKPWAKRLFIPRDGSKFEPVIGTPGDGASPSCAIVDEYHEHQTTAMVDTMTTGMGAREHPLMLQITTSGFNLASPCYDQEQETKKVLEGVIQNDELFGLIYTIDDGDDWTAPESLRKANPNYGVSVGDEFLLSQLEQAKQNPIHQNKFKTKHLNVWCSARSAWINLQEWLAAADTTLKLEDFAGERAIVAADLASKCDLTAAVTIFRRVIDGKAHYYAFSRYWLPEGTVEAPGKNQALYRKWVQQGVLQTTEGATVVFDDVAEGIIEDIKSAQAAEFIFDPFNAIPLAQKITDDEELSSDFPLIEFIQRPWFFSVPMDEVTSALKDGRFHHDGHPVTTWCMSNVVAKPGKKDMYSPAKESNDAKIDGAVALIMGISRLMLRENDTGSIDGWLNAQAKPGH